MIYQFKMKVNSVGSLLQATHLTLSHSVHWHAQLSQITAIVRLCYSIRQLQLSEYTCLWENRISGRSMYAAVTLGGAVPISASGNRNTSGWPLYITRCLCIRERCRMKSEEKLHLCTFRIWCTWQLHKLNAQLHSCLRGFRRKATATAAAATAATTATTATTAIVLLFPAQGPRKILSSLRKMQNSTRSDGAYTCQSIATINSII